MTPYDAWRTNVEDRADGAWEDAIEVVAKEVGDSLNTSAEIVSTLANAEDALHWVCGAVTIPDVHLHAFRDLVKLAQNYRNLVEKEMKEYHDDRD